MTPKIFICSHRSRQGTEQIIKIKANNESDAKRILRQRGILAFAIKESVAESKQSAKPPGFKLNFEKRPGVREKALFVNKLAALVGAGLPIIRSLDLITKQQKQPLFKRALLNVSLNVNGGNSLGDSLRQWPQVFDPLMVTMVEAGEAGGLLEEVLKRLAMLLENNAKLHNQIRGALAYPITVLIIALLVFLGMTIFLIPTFADIFKELGAELPAFTILMLNFSVLLRSPFAIIFMMPVIAGYFILRRSHATPEGRVKIDGFLLQLPLFGELIQKTDTAQFC
ncbi:MAG: type II secretion system F family protein, partial [Synechococcaceae bacterium WB6_3A_227]|nr:type II secretion system F family protein [Synechococcaceae bacterium WB6_3A_227]